MGDNEFIWVNKYLSEKFDSTLSESKHALFRETAEKNLIHLETQYNKNKGKTENALASYYQTIPKVWAGGFITGLPLSFAIWGQCLAGNMSIDHTTQTTLMLASMPVINCLRLIMSQMYNVATGTHLSAKLVDEIKTPLMVFKAEQRLNTYYSWLKQENKHGKLSARAIIQQKTIPITSMQLISQSTNSMIFSTIINILTLCWLNFLQLPQSVLIYIWSCSISAIGIQALLNNIKFKSLLGVKTPFDNATFKEQWLLYFNSRDLLLPDVIDGVLKKKMNLVRTHAKFLAFNALL